MVLKPPAISFCEKPKNFLSKIKIKYSLKIFALILLFDLQSHFEIEEKNQVALENHIIRSNNL